MVISWSSLLNRLSPPCFHTSAGIPSPLGALPSFRLTIALAISSMVNTSSRHMLVLHCWMLSSAWCSMSLGTFYQLISSEQVPFSQVTTLPSVYCRSPLCLFYLRLCAAPLPSFPTSLTSGHGSVFVGVCRHICTLQWWIHCSWLKHSLMDSVSSAHEILCLLQSCPYSVWYWAFILLQFGNSAVHRLLEAFPMDDGT